MSGEAEGRSGTGSLEDVRDVDIPEKSTPRVIYEQLVWRWKTLGAIVVLLVTTVLLAYMDGGISLDTIIFAVITVLLVAYFVATLRNDVKLE